MATKKTISPEAFDSLSPGGQRHYLVDRAIRHLPAGDRVDESRRCLTQLLDMFADTLADERERAREAETPRTPESIERSNGVRFMEGVAWACAFLQRADALNGGGEEHAQARFRAGAQQAQLVPELLAALTARPELIPGANAILVEYLCSSSESGGSVMNVDAYAAMTIDDFVHEDDPDEPQSASDSNIVHLPLRQRGSRDHG